MYIVWKGNTRSATNARETVDCTQFVSDTLTSATLFKKLNTVYARNLIYLVQE